MMVGGSGPEWFFGVGLPHHDTNCEDFRSRDHIWDQTRWALEFFRAYIPVASPRPIPTSSRHRPPSVLPSPCAVYAIYVPEGGPCTLRLEEGQYQVHWYNPRTGGALRTGSVATVDGLGVQALGSPPAEPSRDWATPFAGSMCRGG